MMCVRVGACVGSSSGLWSFPRVADWLKRGRAHKPRVADWQRGGRAENTSSCQSAKKRESKKYLELPIG